MAKSTKALLADRITYHSEAIDKIREGRTGRTWTVEEYQRTALLITEHLAAIEELQYLWETLVGTFPSRLAVGQARSQS